MIEITDFSPYKNRGEQYDELNRQLREDWNCEFKISRYGIECNLPPRKGVTVLSLNGRDRFNEEMFVKADFDKMKVLLVW